MNSKYADPYSHHPMVATFHRSEKIKIIYLILKASKPTDQIQTGDQNRTGHSWLT
jgi:hypothetical protein